MINLNADRLEAAALEAFDLAADSRRWQAAITRALAILRDTPFWDFDGDALVMLSPDSSEIYEVTAGKCERIDGERRVTCKAFAQGQPCKHRAARRLLARYNSTH